jgi:hypothetical protein
MRMKPTVLIVALAAACGAVDPAGAQVQSEIAADARFPEGQAGTSGEDFEFKFTFGGAYTHRFETDIDSGGEFANDTLSFGLTVDRRLSEDVGLVMQVNYVLSSYDFNSATGFGIFEPWDDVSTFNFGAAFSFDITRKFSVFTGPVFQFAGESGAGWGDSFTGGAIAGMTYRFNDNLLLGGGVGIVSQIEDDLRVFPIIIAEWQLADHWRISSRGPAAGRASLEFTGVELVWNPSAAWEFALGGGSAFSRFRLDDDAGLAPNGVGQDESTPIWLRASWRPNSTFAIDAVGGFTFGGELSLDNSEGDGLAGSEYETQPFVGVLASVRF